MHMLPEHHIRRHSLEEEAGLCLWVEGAAPGGGRCNNAGFPLTAADAEAT